jgi:hypothetical protein
MKLRSILLTLAVALAPAYGQYGGELRFCLQGEPKTFNPLLVEDDPSEVVRKAHCVSDPIRLEFLGWDAVYGRRCGRYDAHGNGS